MHMLRRLLTKKRIVLYGIGLVLLLAACSPGGTDSASSRSSSDPPTPTDTSTAEATSTTASDSTRLPESKYDDLEIITLLPRDAIPAIDNPQFLNVAEADRFYDPDELIMGVEFNGDARAYSVPFLSGHEIVNDTVGGVKIAVTW